MSDVAAELRCDWHTINDVVTTYGEALLAAALPRMEKLARLGFAGVRDAGVIGRPDTEAGEVPTAILRATQFHGFAGQLIDWMAKGPVLACPKQPVQTVDVTAVADELVALVGPCSAARKAASAVPLSRS